MAYAFDKLYRLFLTEVGKHRVGSVNPEQFAMFFNLAQNEVVTNKLSMMDVNKKINDDLNPLVVTANYVMTTDTTQLHKCFTTERPSNCKRIKSIHVLINGNTNAKCIYLPANQKSKLDSVYDKPNDKRVYYELSVLSTTNVIRVFVPVICTSAKIYIDYYKEPDYITESDVVKTSTNYIFSNEMSIEIISAAARMCLEANQDARYGTFAGDQKNKSNNQ